MFNYNTQQSSYEQSRKDFVRSLQIKQQYYEKTVNNENVSAKAVIARNIELKTLINFHNNTVNFIAAQGEAIKLTEQKLTHKNNYSMCLEAVLLMHGVNNFMLYAPRGFSSLLSEVKYLYSENQLLVPERLKKTFGIPVYDANTRRLSITELLQR